MGHEQIKKHLKQFHEEFSKQFLEGVSRIATDRSRSLSNHSKSLRKTYMKFPQINNDFSDNAVDFEKCSNLLRGRSNKSFFFWHKTFLDFSNVSPSYRDRTNCLLARRMPEKSSDYFFSAFWKQNRSKIGGSILTILASKKKTIGFQWNISRSHYLRHYLLICHYLTTEQ